MKVYLIYPRHKAVSLSDSSSPPLGLLYIASYLKSKNIDVKVFDLNIIKKWRRILDEIIEESPNYLGLSSNVSNFNNTLDIAKLVKTNNKDVKVLVGGPYPSCVPEKYLESNYIDAVCIGEGERTCYEYITQDKPVPGLMIRRGTELHFTGKREYIENLDELPFPALDQINLKKYYFYLHKASPISNIITSRGCPYGCTFCFHGVHGYKWRSRSPKNVFDEIKWQVEDLGVRELIVMDDNFTLDFNRAEKICDLIIKNKLKVSWQCINGLRVDKINRKLLIKMKKAGCWNIAIAPETGDPTILKKIRKGFTLDQVKIARQWFKEIDMFCTMYFIIGFPFEKDRHVLNTIKFIKQMKPDFMLLSKYNPFPNTLIQNEYELKTIENEGYRTLKLSKYLERIFFQTNLKFYLNPKNLLKWYKMFGTKKTFLAAMKVFHSIIQNKLEGIKYIQYKE